MALEASENFENEIAGSHQQDLEAGMANWRGMARTNYFRVKDEAAFRQWAQELELAVITDAEGRIGFYSNTHDGGFPSNRTAKDSEEIEDIDFAAEVAHHLDGGSIAILMEAGYEKGRYVSGYAIAVNNEGRTIDMVLSDIREKAARFFNVDVQTISEATY